MLIEIYRFYLKFIILLVIEAQLLHQLLLKFHKAELILASAALLQCSENIIL